MGGLGEVSDAGSLHDAVSSKQRKQTKVAKLCCVKQTPKLHKVEVFMLWPDTGESNATD